MTGRELDRPAALLPMSVTDARDVMAVYQDICKAVLTDDDLQQIDERSFVKRSGFQKLAVAYGLSTEIRSLEVDRDDEGAPIRAHAIVQATHHSGRSAEGDGACDRTERGRRRSDKLEHDLRATATTRATNRAISNLIAFGAMSAEEVEADGAPAVGPLAQQFTPPAWATAADGADLSEAAANMVRIVRAFGDTEPAATVRALGAAIRAECGGTIPLAVARTVAHMADLIPQDAEVAQDPPEPAAAATEDPTPPNQPQED